MLKHLNIKSYITILLIPISMVLLMWSITKSSFFFKYHQELSKAIVLDLLVTMPFLYFLAIRKRKVPKLSVVSVFVLGVFTATYILPKDNQSLLLTIKTYFFPLLELAVFSFFLYKAHAVYKVFSKEEHSKLDFFDATSIAVKSVLPNKISFFLTTEIAVVYYTFFNWKKTKLKHNEFSNYKENGIKTLLFALIFIIFIETFVLHVYLEKFSLMAAWIFSVVSIYTIFQVFALIKSLSKRPFFIDNVNNQVVLRFGFFGIAKIPFSNINSVEMNTKDLPQGNSIVPFSPLGNLGGHNVIFNLKNNIEFEGFYGIKKVSDRIAVFVDDKNRFVSTIEKQLSKIKY